MSNNFTEKYPYLKFKKLWDLNTDTWLLLGQCEIYIKAISNTPILPEHHSQLLNVSLIRGAQATTAIEGNTLSTDEIEQIQKGLHLPPSKGYQEIEVKNILEAFNVLLNEVVYEGKTHAINKELILRFHRMVGKSLGAYFDAIPGLFRIDDRIVGTYLPPDNEDVPALMEMYFQWLSKIFHSGNGQDFHNVVIESIVSHVYLEWIHPFGDGNGRTGRLLEFYILLRGGNPDIASHILSNHYNQTRSEYYRQLQMANDKRDLTEFIEYALLGLRDGLSKTLGTIQESLFEITWQKLIYDRFADKSFLKVKVFKRQRELMLSFPLDRQISVDEVFLLTPELARKYATSTTRTVKRDLQELVDLELVIRSGKIYRANTSLLGAYFAKTKI